MKMELFDTKKQLSPQLLPPPTSPPGSTIYIMDKLKTKTSRLIAGLASVVFVLLLAWQTSKSCSWSTQRCEWRRPQPTSLHYWSWKQNDFYHQTTVNEARATGDQYLLGVGKADITGYLYIYIYVWSLKAVLTN